MLCLSLFFSALLPLMAWAFQVPSSPGLFSVVHQPRSISSRNSTTTQLGALNVSEYPQRDYGTFAEWDFNYGLSQVNGFRLADQYGEWVTMTGQNTSAESREMHAPYALRLLSSQIQAQEFPHFNQTVALCFDATNPAFLRLGAM